MGQRTLQYDGAGVFYAVGALLAWGSVLLFLKHLTPYIDAWTANGWRYGLSALMWLPVLLSVGLRGRLPPGIWRRAVAPSIVNCIGQACFALAPYYIGPGLTGFLLRASLLASVCGALILFADERPLIRNRLFWGGMVLVVCGSAGTVLLGQAPVRGGTATGIALGLAAGLFFGLYGVSVRYWMRGISPVVSFSAISLYTAVGMIGLMVIKGDAGGLAVFGLSAFNWFMLIASAVLGIAMGHVFYYAAIARLGVAITSATIQLAPFLGGIGAMLVFGEVLTIGQWMSGGLLLGGAWVLLLAERSRSGDPRPHPQAASTPFPEDSWPISPAAAGMAVERPVGVGPVEPER